MPEKIFLSYRRGDSAGSTLHLAERLKAKFGAGRVFVDVDGISPGKDFVAVLDEQLRHSRVLLAVIGPGWIDARDPLGRRRLDDEADHLRREIATGLARGIPVIPVILDGGRMPRASELPADIAMLARMQAIEISHASFAADVDRLVAVMRREHMRRRWFGWDGAVAIILLVVGGIIMVQALREESVDRSELDDACATSAAIKDGMIDAECFTKRPKGHYTYVPPNPHAPRPRRPVGLGLGGYDPRPDAGSSPTDSMAGTR